MSDLLPAVICAAQLLGYTGQLPNGDAVEWIDTKPPVELCKAAGGLTGYECIGVTDRDMSNGKIRVTMPAASLFEWQLHEAIHVIQIHAKLPYPNHELVYRLQAQAHKCERPL